MPGFDEMSSFPPSGRVASADSCAEVVRPTAQTEGDTTMSETDDAGVDDPQPALVNARHDPASAPAILVVAEAAIPRAIQTADLRPARA